MKIGDWKPNTSTLYQILSDLQPYSKKYGLTVNKPNKFRAGETSTLAIIQNAFTVDSDGNLDLNQFVATLKNIENMLNDYSSDKSTPPTTNQPEG